MERITIPGILCCLALVFAIDATSAATTIYRDRYVAPTKAANPRSTLINHDWTAFACYDSATAKLVDCSFTQEVVGLKEPSASLDNNGGHLHDGHPLIEPANGTLIYPENTCPGEPLKVCGRTNYSMTSKIIHNIPQASGNIVKKSVVIAPARPTWWPADWICWFGCDDDSNVFTYVDTVHVEVPNLNPLPDPSPSDYYVKVRGNDNGHPEADYATHFTVGTIKLVAENYWILTGGRRLSINDMSLPKGGMFDLNSNWWVANTGGNGHVSHRLGTDADINRARVNNVPLGCNEDLDLRLAVDAVVPPVSRANGEFTALFCESGGRIHIDFEL